MGAAQSTHTSLDASPMTNEDVPTSSPKLRRNETFEEKFYRKFTTEPLVPIGCLVTAYFLGSGINSFYKRDAARSQKMMRARVGAQFATLMIFIGYYGVTNFDWTLAPMYQASKEAQREHMIPSESETSQQPSTSAEKSE